MTNVAGVGASMTQVHGIGASLSPMTALHALQLRPISVVLAKLLLEHYHYLHSIPGGTKLAFGVFVVSRLLGVVTLGVGPKLVHRLVDGATPDDCLTLTRLWLSDELPHNSESRVLGLVLRALRKHTTLKFLVTYADPAEGHRGIIYQATNWLYTGLSQGTPLYDLGDGRACHSRSLSHTYGTHSVRHFARHGVDVRLVAQVPKHRYFYFLDQSWQHRLKVPILSYPKKEQGNESGCSSS